MIVKDEEEVLARCLNSLAGIADEIIIVDTGSGDATKQIAAAYGIGLRMDFTYFLLRFDLGFKAINPAVNQERWPIIHPKWKRDTNFHFSVGYPF